ncbi:26S proteasome non-ATPase regulatory subunit 12-like [Acyrthosiphon pisum]|uniref:Uncharacterized protein n=1 Tax=Acyrthosiphon pisum TaxID=7029 RepID=A0A8R2JV15_ACYPI|nr:26S proteasome non-ATPase regulatory subunit 12-like [Acyrthosiphon pisum]|eukprot:XP_003241718.1 PREDICTED: 26S proteasome non-ATPase regulatory subunit 12-like [Acyrthosiphon pisum]
MDNVEPLNTDGGRTVKMVVDYTAMCDETIAVAESLASSGKIQEALNTLYMLQKQTINASDLASTTRLMMTIKKLCLEVKEGLSWMKLELEAIMKECSTFNARIQVEQTEFTKLAQRLAQNEEVEGDVTGVASIFQELQVDDSIKTPEEDELLKYNKK